MSIEELYKDLLNTPMDIRTGDWEYLEILYEYTLKHKPELVFDSGTYTGKSALAILTAMRFNGRGKVITIDNVSWTPKESIEQGRNSVDLALERFKKLKFTNVEFIFGSSINPPDDVKKQRYDFVFLDTIHNYTQVKAELEIYTNLTENIFIHDCEGPADEGSSKAVLEFLDNNKEWRLSKLGTKWGLWFIQKNSIKLLTESKTLIITTARDIPLMNVWLPSLQKNGKYNGDILLLDYDLSPGTIQKLKIFPNIMIVKTIQKQEWIVGDRYRAYQECLKDIYRNYEVIMVTDGNDIEFLKPIQPLFDMAKEKVCYVKEKGLNKEWRWSRNPIYSDEIWNTFKDQPTINGGMYVGPSELIYKIITYIAENLKYDNGFGFDQSLLNGLIYYYKIPSQEIDPIWNYDPRRELYPMEKIAIVHRINSEVSGPKSGGQIQGGKKQLKICYYPAYSIESGSSRQRVFYIAEKLKEWEHEVWFQSAPFLADIIVIQKTMTPLNVAFEAKKRGIPVVFDYCDQGSWYDMIKLANIVTTDSQGLLDQYNVKSGRVIVNPIDLLKEPLPRRIHKKEKGLDLVYFAFSANLGAFKNCRGALERLRKEGYNFTFTYISGSRNENPFQGFDHNYLPWKYDTFSSDLQKYDIAIIPQEYDWKGPNKQTDACAHNLPAVCERTLPNKELYELAGVPEYLAKSEDEWYNGIKKLFDPKERNAFLDKVLPVVWGIRSLDYITKQWETLFEETIRNKNQ